MSRRKLGSKPPSIAQMLKRTGRSPLSSTDTSSPNRGGRAGASHGAVPASTSATTKGETDG